MRMKRRQRSVVVWGVFAACIGWVAFQGWQALLSVVAIALGMLGMQALQRWEKRGKD